MANLSENTIYGSNTQKPLANFSNIGKAIKNTSQTASPTAPVKKSLDSRFNPSDYATIFGSANKSAQPTNAEQMGFPVNAPVGTQQNSKIEPVPEGYSQFLPANGDKWSAPTEKTVMSNWPTALGGGQYATDQSQPGAMIKSDRKIMDSNLNPGAKQKILGKLSPKDYQVDHIIPLWLGGADTLPNLQVLDVPTHEIKTNVQAVALTLLANKKITLDEAKNMALTWKDKDAKGLPSADEKGYIPVDVAQKYAQKWKDDMTKPKTLKYLGSSFKDSMNRWGDGWLPDVVRELPKGFIGGVSAGIIPGTQASEDSGTAGLISNTIGNIAGTIWGLGKFAKGLSWATKGTKSLLGLNKAATLTENAMKTAGVAADVGNLSAKAINSKKRVETLEKMAKEAGLFGLWGQLGLSGKEVTGQQDAELSNHMSQFFTDVVYGGIMGSQGQTLKGYGTVGLGTAAWALMEGEEIVPALQNAALMTSLHAMGYKKGMIDPKVRIGNEEAYKMSASTFNQYLGDVVPTVKKGEKVPEILKLDIPKVNEIKTEYQTKYPNDQKFKDMPEIKTDAEAIDFLEKASRKQLGNIIAKSNGTISQEDIKKEMTRIIVAKNQLYNQTLPPKQRAQKELEDLFSMGAKLRPQIKSTQMKGATNSTKMLEELPVKYDNEVFENTNKVAFPTGNVPTTGYGDNIDLKSKETINDLYKNPDKYSDKLYIVKDPETSAIMRLIEQEQIAAGQKPTVGNPDHALRVFVKTIDGEIKPAGYMPREESFDIKKNSLNKTYVEITNRLRHTVETAKTPEELKLQLSKDKAQIQATDDDILKLFNSKADLKNISDEDLYALLKPANAFEKYDAKGLNNSTISENMDKNGLKVLVVDKSKIMPTGGAVPRNNPDNPYLAVNLNEQDWLRSIALKDKKAPVKTPVQEGVSKIVEKKKVNDLTSTINKIAEKTKTADPVAVPPIKPIKAEIPQKTSQESLPLFETPVRKADLEANLPVEKSKTVEPTLVSKIEETPLKTKIEVQNDTNVKGESVPNNDELIKDTFEAFKKDTPISPGDIRTELDGVNKAAVKAVDKKLRNMDPESQEAQDLIKFRDSFTREKIDAGAVDSYKTANNDEHKGAELFIKRISDSFKSKGLEDPTVGYKNSQSYKKVFRDAVFNKPVTVFKMGDKGMVMERATGKEPLSYMEETLGKKTVYFEESKDASVKKPTEDEKRSFLISNGFMPIYYDNKPGSLLGIEFDSAMANGKKITDKGALDDFLNSVGEKLGFKIGEDTLNSIAKRSKSLNSREQVNPIKGEIWKTYVIKNDAGINKTVKETTPNWDDIKVNDVVANKVKALEDLAKKRNTDGSQYGSPENIARMAEQAGFIHTPLWIKPTQSFIDKKTNNLFHQKLEMRAWTDIEKEQFEKGLGVKLGPNDIVTFEDNVKVGYGKVGEDKGKYWLVESPSESIRFKYNEPHEVGGSVSLGGILTKIPAESGVGKELGEHYKKYADNIKKISEELQNSSGAADIEAIWKKYPEFYKDKWMDNLYGELKKSAEHGAGIGELGRTLNKEINKIITDDYLGGRFMNGDNLHIKPDWGVKIDPKTGKNTYLSSGEVMISKESFINLYGKDAYNELKDGKEFDVLAYRYPTLKDTSVAKMKVLIAEDHRQKIGNSQIVTNSADTMKFDHDTDGDTIQIFAIGGEKGIPQKMADYFDSKQKEGNMIFPDLEKTSKMIFDGKDTYSKLLKYSEQTLKGGEAIGIAASSARPMRFLKSNNYEMRISAPTKEGTRTVDQYLNGKIFKTETKPASDFKDSPSGAFTVKPNFSDKESYLIGQIGQEAVDSVGTTDLVKRFADYGGDASTYITENLFSNTKDKAVKELLRKSLADFQVPYTLGKNSLTELKPYITRLKEVKANGGKLGPVEEVILNLDGLTKIDDASSDASAQQGRSTFARTNVLNKFKDELRPVDTSKLKKFSSLVEEIRNNPQIKTTGDKKKITLSVWDKFKEENKLSKKELKDFALWAATSPKANLAFMDKYKKSKYVVRPTFLINESPEVAKVYFEGENMFKNIKNSIKKNVDPQQQ